MTQAQFQQQPFLQEPSAPPLPEVNNEGNSFLQYLASSCIKCLKCEQKPLLPFQVHTVIVVLLLIPVIIIGFFYNGLGVIPFCYGVLLVTAAAKSLRALQVTKIFGFILIFATLVSHCAMPGIICPDRYCTQGVLTVFSNIGHIVITCLLFYQLVFVTAAINFIKKEERKTGRSQNFAI